MRKGHAEARRRRECRECGEEGNRRWYFSASPRLCVPPTNSCAPARLCVTSPYSSPPVRSSPRLRAAARDRITPHFPTPPPDMTPDEKKQLEERVILTLKTIYDPEMPVDIYELGLVYDVVVNDDASIYIKMTLTSPACPVAGSLPGEVEEKVAETMGANGA